MTTRDGQPAAGSLALKKFRVKRCTVQLHLPGGVTFTCQLEKHTLDVEHKEVGVVVMPNNTIRRYEMVWRDEGFATIRQNTREKVRQSGNHTNAE